MIEVERTRECARGGRRARRGARSAWAQVASGRPCLAIVGCPAWALLARCGLVVRVLGGGL
eukprot:8887021-Pyramimonas_sp.AAC.1